jgi:hypothetical protein
MHTSVAHNQPPEQSTKWGGFVPPPSAPPGWDLIYGRPAWLERAAAGAGAPWAELRVAGEGSIPVTANAPTALPRVRERRALPSKSGKRSRDPQACIDAAIQFDYMGWTKARIGELLCLEGVRGIPSSAVRGYIGLGRELLARNGVAPWAIATPAWRKPWATEILTALVGWRESGAEWAGDLGDPDDRRVLPDDDPEETHRLALVAGFYLASGLGQGHGEDRPRELRQTLVKSRFVRTPLPADGPSVFEPAGED